MKNNLPKQYKPSLWERIRKRFMKNSGTENIIEETKRKTEDNNSFKEKLDINTIMKNNETKEELLKIIEENPELLETLSIEKLEKINKMYDEKIEQLTVKLNTLKRELQNKI